MNAIIESFRQWWNWLAEKNGKQKFRTHEEAVEFVRKVQRENGGPNAKIQAMRERYEEINRTRDHQNTSRFDAGGNSAVC